LATTPLFFDHNSSTPLSPRVEKRMLEVLHNFFGNPHSQTHRHGWNAARLLSDLAYDVSSQFSKNFHTIFTSGATEANNLAFNLTDPSKRPNVLIGPLEHSAVVEPAARLAHRHGGKLVKIPCDREGYLDLEFATDALLNSCCIVSVSFASGEIGTVQKGLDRLRQKAQRNGAWFHSDMSQSLQHQEARLFGRACDAISISGHKIYGPQGVGALVASSQFLNTLEPILIGGGQQNGIRAGTIPTFLCAGLAEALSETNEWISSGGPEDLADGSYLLYKLLEREIGAKYPEPIRLAGPQKISDRTPGNLAIILNKNVDASDLLLASSAIFSASQSSACHSGQETATPTLRAIGLNDREARSVIRFGLGRGTTEDDIKTVANTIGQLI
jgi:cysteine desulfurase